MDLDVYGLCLGGNVFGWTADRDASFAVLDAYVEAGGNFIDTADTYMRPNMGISETIIGEWMAARGNRDALVIATKVGSDGGLSADEHRRARRRFAAAAADRPDRPLLRAQGRRQRAGRGDRAGVRRARARGQGPLRRGVQPLRRAAARVARARGARGPRALRLAAAALQPRRARALRARVRADRGRARARGRALLRAGQRLPHRQVPRRARPTAAARAPRPRASTSTRAGVAVLDALDEVAAAHDATPAAVAVAWLRPSPGVVAPIASARSRRAAGGGAARGGAGTDRRASSRAWTRPRR